MAFLCDSKSMYHTRSVSLHKWDRIFVKWCLPAIHENIEDFWKVKRCFLKSSVQNLIPVFQLFFFGKNGVLFNLNWSRNKQPFGYDWWLTACSITNFRKLSKYESQKPFTLNQPSVNTQRHNINFSLSKSKVFTGKSQTETSTYWLGDSEVNTARSRFEIFS